MRKAINFDIDTKKYEEATGKKAPTAYAKIRSFLAKYNFEHRQGSGYISNKNITSSDIIMLINDMTSSFEWLKNSVRQIDVTSIGRQHSMLYVIKKSNNHKLNLSNVEI